MVVTLPVLDRVPNVPPGTFGGARRHAWVGPSALLGRGLTGCNGAQRDGRAVGIHNHGAPMQRIFSHLAARVAGA
jgi:hypothetical protein